MFSSLSTFNLFGMISYIRFLCTLTLVVVKVFLCGNVLAQTAASSFTNDLHTSSSPDRIEWTEVWRSSPTDAEYLFTDPRRMILHDSQLFVTDFNGERPVWVFGANDGRVQNYMSALGEGPGEVRMIGAIDIVDDRHIAVQDPRSQAISLFELNGITFLHRLDEQVTSTVGFGDHVMVQTPLSSSDRDVFARAYDVITTEEGRVALGDVRWEVSIDQVGETFIPLQRNPLLKQGPVIVENGIAYVAFLNAGPLVGLSAETGEVLFVTQEPHNVDPPDFLGAREGIDMMAPPINRYPTMALTLTTDADHVYALHSGVVVETRDDMKRIEEAEQVDVYDKITGTYIRSVHLPYPARDLVVTDSHVYLLTMDEEPVLFKYEKPGALFP